MDSLRCFLFSTVDTLHTTSYHHQYTRYRVFFYTICRTRVYIMYPGTHTYIHTHMHTFILIIQLMVCILLHLHKTMESDLKLDTQLNSWCHLFPNRPPHRHRTATLTSTRKFFHNNNNKSGEYWNIRATRKQQLNETIWILFSQTDNYKQYSNNPLFHQPIAHYHLTPR